MGEELHQRAAVASGGLYRLCAGAVYTVSASAYILVFNCNDVVTVDYRVLPGNWYPRKYSPSLCKLIGGFHPLIGVTGHRCHPLGVAGRQFPVEARRPDWPMPIRSFVKSNLCALAVDEHPGGCLRVPVRAAVECMLRSVVIAGPVRLRAAEHLALVDCASRDAAQASSTSRDLLADVGDF